MLLLGIDIGTSSIKVSVVDAHTQQCIASAHYPETETEVIVKHAGWAEQTPETWWENVQLAILKCNASKVYNSFDIGAIGIAYQMHGLVLVDKTQTILRDSIIWCDSRAVDIGDKAFAAIGEEKCLSHLLNSPGNFTASKLAWVKENEPEIFDRIYKILLPGDFISMKLTGEINTTISALSEGVFWDFKNNELSKDVCSYFNFDLNIFPEIQPLFSSHGLLKNEIAEKLSLKKNISVAYKAGDQPNNALSLNVFNAGEVAATAGTSGVIYAVSDQLNHDNKSRINSFAHVNYTEQNIRTGNLLCINGTGIFNRWIKNITTQNISYDDLNKGAAKINIGSEGLLALPFGNGAERMFNNKIIGAQFSNLDLNIHGRRHLIRAAQEGIAFSFRYGLDIMKENGIDPKLIKAGKTNMFLSDVFTASFAGVTNTTIELYQCDGSVGAAIGAGLGAGVFANEQEAFQEMKPLQNIEPSNVVVYENLYQRWKKELQKHLDA